VFQIVLSRIYSFSFELYLLFLDFQIQNKDNFGNLKNNDRVWLEVIWCRKKLGRKLKRWYLLCCVVLVEIRKESVCA